MRISENLQVKPTWELTRVQKLVLILRDYPEIRNSYDMIVEKYHKIYEDSRVKRTTLERDIRMVQYDLGLYSPLERVKRARKQKQQEIIEEYKQRKYTVQKFKLQFFPKKSPQKQWFFWKIFHYFF